MSAYHGRGKPLVTGKPDLMNCHQGQDFFHYCPAGMLFEYLNGGVTASPLRWSENLPVLNVPASASSRPGYRYR